MKRTLDSSKGIDVKGLKGSYKDKEIRYMTKDIKSFLYPNPSKESAGSKKKGIIVNRSISTHQINGQFKNKIRSFVCQKDDHPRREPKNNNQSQKRINTEFIMDPEESYKQNKGEQLPIKSIKEYLRTQAPLAFSQINPELQVSINMRKLLINWMIELTHALRFTPQTLFHSAYLIDSMLEAKPIQFSTHSNSQQIELSIQNLQLLAMACILISSKYEEISPPPLKKFLEFSQFCYSKRKLIGMESQILAAHSFNLNFPTRYIFITHYIQQYQCYSPEKQKRLNHMCQYLCTLSLVELWENCTEKQIGQGIFFLASKVVGCQNSFENKSDKKMYAVAWKMKQIWNNNYGGIISHIFDSDKYSFVGGVYIRQK